MAPGMHSVTIAESERRELSRISSSTVALFEVTGPPIRKHKSTCLISRVSCISLTTGAPRTAIWFTYNITNMCPVLMIFRFLSCDICTV
jgi:hypothetical protein